MSSLDALVQLAGTHFLNGIVEGAAVAVFASVLLGLLTSKSSGTRFGVWFSSLLAVAALSIAIFIPGVPALSAHGPRFVFPIRWAEYAFAAWAVLAAAGLLRVLLGLKKIAQIRRRCVAAPENIVEPAFSELLNQLGFKRTVRLLVSDELRVPTAMGFLRPAVVLPRWVIEELSPEELRPVILHELGHLRRWDDWTNLAQRVIRALLFFHPAVWWIDSRLSLEREMACDDLVLSRTGNARAYAECLVALAEKAAARSGMALALAAVSRMRQTATRLARILEHNRLVETRLSRPAVAVVALVGSAALIALPRTPALIAFQSATSATSTSAMSVREAGTSMLRPASYRVEQGVPHVVPAMLRADDSARFAGKRRGQLHKKAAGQAANRNRTKSALLTQASMRASEQSSPTFLLVVETSDDFIGVSHVWTLCVWRVPYSPNSGSTARQRQQEEIVSKSI